MVSPHPVYSPRGTPIAVLNRCRALAALGHQVDLVTYPIGEDVPVPGLRYLRAPGLPGLRSVRVGPSLAKIPLNISVFVWTCVQLLRRRYDVIHTHEEAGAFGWLLAPLARIPHVYDMGNDLAVVLSNYGFSPRHPLVRLGAWLERRMVRSASVTLVHFPELAERVAEYAPGRACQLVFNIPIEPPADPKTVRGLRRAWSPDGAPLVVYTGTLEVYQGLPLLLDAVCRTRSARLVVVGGRPEQVAALRRLKAAADLGGRLRFTGTLPPDVLPSCLAAADVLISTRSSGTNTPLKLFSYLASGKPIVATRIRSHTQVLDESVAVLVEPEPAAIAAGIERLLGDAAGARRLGLAAAALARERYGVAAFLESTARGYLHLGAPPPARRDLEAMARRLLPARLVVARGGR
jgi:glycosyltransferase involved in cell wall biosynthesis